MFICDEIILINLNILWSISAGSMVLIMLLLSILSEALACSTKEFTPLQKLHNISILAFSVVYHFPTKNCYKCSSFFSPMLKSNQSFYFRGKRAASAVRVLLAFCTPWYPNLVISSDNSLRPSLSLCLHVKSSGPTFKNISSGGWGTRYFLSISDNLASFWEADGRGENFCHRSFWPSLSQCSLIPGLHYYTIQIYFTG